MTRQSAATVASGLRRSSAPTGTNFPVTKMAVPLPPVDFSYLQENLQSDSDLREQIREATRDVEREERRCQAVMNRVHSVGRADSEWD